MKKKAIRSKKDLGEFFSELREQTGLTQNDFARLMLLDDAWAQQRYSRWEVGSHAPPMEDLLRIIEFLGYELIIQRKTT